MPELRMNAETGRRGGGEVLTKVCINQLEICIWQKWREQEHVWPAARLLSEYLTHDVTKPEERFIVELGAGTGLVSLCLAAADARAHGPSDRRIVATDCDHAALKNMKRNFEANRLAGKTTVEKWDWTALVLPHWSNDVELIVASDIIYDNTIAYLHLSRHLARILSMPTPPGCKRERRALMLLQVRNSGLGYTGSSVEAFVADLCARGLLVEDVPLQHCCADEFEQGSLKFICVTAPRENGLAQQVDFTSLPGAFGRLDRSCLGQGVVDEELVGQLQQALDG